MNENQNIDITALRAQLGLDDISTAEEGAIVKREWWKRWEGDRPPSCDLVIQSWDTAFLKSQRADYSARTTWVIWTTEDGDTNIILLDAFKERYEFPELKQKAYET